MKREISFQACQNVALDLRNRFGSVCFERWEVCGDVRLRKDGHDLVHVAIPKWGPSAGDPEANLLWARAVYLQSLGSIAPWVSPGGMVCWVEEGSSVIEVDFRGHRHTINLATKSNWGLRLAEHTGPGTYFRMMRVRLELSGTFKIHAGNVCWYDRRSEPCQMRVIPVEDERHFFRLARTKWKEPPARFAQPLTNTTRGIESEWIPPGVIPFANPEHQLHLFDHGSRPVQRRHGGIHGFPRGPFTTGAREERAARPAAPGGDPGEREAPPRDLPPDSDA
jgi:hypothetical protein